MHYSCELWDKTSTYDMDKYKHLHVHALEICFLI